MNGGATSGALMRPNQSLTAACWERLRCIASWSTVKNM